ncbi:hypothetical protein FE257_009040 [Aspergillus nanangensis]|uniref:Uncharacterized protein n=1 Tax=Aspergillus nanangensis TaxID=2582783 RepID=A0AAD4CX25_ASPNN|nr:hypothetical protein FE257_009040 [Aspergillus nanangensis]
MSSENNQHPKTLRHRGITRSATYQADGSGSASSTRFPSQRRNSTLSDSISEARHSIRSSTDDLLFPRVIKRGDADVSGEESHWQSAPLGLALLPAIAGVFFQNGGAIVTDVTLLVLAAIFLNWDWYRSAQAIRQHDKYYSAAEVSLDVDIDDTLPETDSNENQESQQDAKRDHHYQRPSDAASAASRELQIHELVALASCFILPIVGTWLLHTIRSKLSRPSEGLVSNYNLTIFLLASEIRPFSHLLKLVQARTLYLQRVVASSLDDESDKIDPSKIADFMTRLEELEAHVAETAAARLPTESSTENQPAAQEQEFTKTVVSQATADVRKAFQPDIDALTRAVRRYEKRTTITSMQTESKLHELETQVNDAISLASAAHRSRSQHRGLLLWTIQWIYAAVLLPGQVFMSLITMPIQLTKRCLKYGWNNRRSSGPAGKSNKGKAAQDRKSPPPRRPRRGPQQATTDSKGLKPISEHK